MTKQLYLDATGGVDFINSVLQDKEITGIGGYIKVLLTNEFENTNVRVSFERRGEPNIYRKELFDLWQTSVGITRQLLKRFGCSFSGFYGQATSKSSDVTEKLLGTDIAFTYEFSENLKGNLRYAHSERTSTVVTKIPEYNRNTILSGLTIEF